MSLFNYIKAGAKVAPAFSIILYYLFFALDLFTTYLVTPDLKFEVNWVVRYLNLNWTQIIILVLVNAIFISSFFLIALNYIHSYYRENDIKHNHPIGVKVFYNSKMIVSIILLCLFYSHLCSLVFVTINNYLNYIFLYKIENFLTKISAWYLNIGLVSQPLYFLYIKTLLTIIAVIFTVYRVRSIRNKYRTIPM
jgi:hypothetical protein